MPAPSSSTVMCASGLAVADDDAYLAGGAGAAHAVLDGVLDQRLQAQERHQHGQHLRGHLHAEAQLVAEAGALQQQVAVDAGQLVGQGGEVVRAAQRVPGEVGEVEQQLAGPRGVGADERGDRGERVVDEVRRDLRAQGAHLGLQRAAAGDVELGQLQLAGDPAADLGDGAHERGAHLVVEGGQRADHGAVHGQRHHDRPMLGPMIRPMIGPAIRPGIGRALVRQRPAGEDLVRPHGQGGAGVGEHVVGARPLPGQRRLRGGDRDGAGAEQDAQMPHGPAGGVTVEAAPQGGGGHRGEVQRGEGRVVRPVLARRRGTAPQEPRQREAEQEGQEGGQRHARGGQHAETVVDNLPCPKRNRE